MINPNVQPTAVGDISELVKMSHLRHIAFIMDGNGRWANARMLPREAGHKAGAENFKKIVRYCRSVGIECCTVYAFSTENWSRPKGEVDAIMNLLEKFAKEAENCSLNRIGQTAADFSFSDRKGRVYRLHEIKADWTILFFSNPGCKACKDIIEYIKSIEGITPMIIANHVAVVNVYIDEDLGEWYDYMPYYPKNWYNGYDHNLMVRSENLYDVRAIPSLYLLDKDKKVVLKDAPEDKFYAKLNQLL
jgi:thiol-disulfide isomerase/thioredoxin